MSQTPGRRDRRVALAVGLALLLLAVAVGAQKIRDFDYWWHLRTGQLIVETGAIPTTDPYTYTVPGNRWIDIHWLFQLGLWGTYALGGHTAVVIAETLCVVALAILLGSIGWRRERAAVTGLGVGLALLLVADRIMPRPEVPSFLLLAGVLALLDRFERRGDPWLYALVPLQLLWVNLHGLFALGLAVAGMHVAAEVLRPLVQPGERLRPDRLRRLATATALAGAASLVNPNLLDGALYPLQQLDMVGPAHVRGVFGSLIAELIPPLAESRGLVPLALALFGLLAGLSFLAMLANWRRVRTADPLVWLAFLYLALGAQRNVALFAIVAAPIFVRNANQLLERRRPPERLVGAIGAGVAAILLLLAVDVARGSFFPRIHSWREPGFEPLDVLHPVGAVDWIVRERPPGPLFHHMADGGYLLWRLWPDYRILVDGRLEVYGPERFLDLQVADLERFRVLDEEYRFGAALLHYSLIPSDPLLRWLRWNPNWRLVFLDDVAALFVRVPEGGTLAWGEVDLDAPDLFPPLDGRPGLSDRQRRLSRTHLYMALGRYERARTLFEDTLELYPDLPQGPIVRATLLARTGFPAAAEAILRQLLAERPHDPVLLTEIGDIRFDAGDLAAARELYDRALALDTDLSYALLRRGLLAEAESDSEGAAQYYGRAIGVAEPADPAALQAAQRLRALREAPRLR